MDSEDKSRSSTTSNENDEEKKISNLLQLPTFADNIFRHLPASDLSSCAKTCRSWNVIAVSTKKKRRQIYVMQTLYRYLESSFPSFVRQNFLNLWSETNVAIAIGGTIEYSDMANLIRVLKRLKESETELSYRIKRIIVSHYYQSMQNSKRWNKVFRNHLPRNCTFVNFNLAVQEQDSSCFIPTYNPYHFLGPTSRSRLILIPSISGLEIQPFILPPPDGTSFPDRKTIERLIVSSEKNFLSNDIKCMLVFAHEEGRDIKKKTTYAETSIAKYISEETIIIGGHSLYCPISAGIAISGTNVSIECFYIEDRSCCVKHCFSVLKETGLHNENGIAFLLKQCNFEGFFVHSFWSEYFPKIVLTTIYLNSGLITSTMPSKLSSFQLCNVCGKEPNIHDPMDKKLIFVFICLKKCNCKVIEV